MQRLHEALLGFRDWSINKSDDRRLNTGFTRLDGVLHGLFPGNLIILAARPSVGKSAFGCEIALRNAEKGNASAIFSCEMSNMEILQRFISNKAQINLNDVIDRSFMNDKPMEQKIGKAMRELKTLPLYLHDEPGLTVSDIRRTLQTVKNLKLVVIDYLQLMKPVEKAETRNLELSNITTNLKQMPKEFW